MLVTPGESRAAAVAGLYWHLCLKAAKGVAARAPPLTQGVSAELEEASWATRKFQEKSDEPSGDPW